MFATLVYVLDRGLTRATDVHTQNKNVSLRTTARDNSFVRPNVLISKAKFFLVNSPP